MSVDNEMDLIEMVPPNGNDPRIKSAISELRELIARHYPTATFEVVRRDDPDGIYLIPTVDVNDLEEVAAVFEERLIDMQVEEGLPVYVVPDWPDERVRAQLQQTNRKLVSAQALTAIASGHP